MTYEEFLTTTIDEGLEAAREDYSSPENKSRLEGAEEGFEACRGKSVDDLRQLFSQSQQRVGEAFIKYQEDLETYWKEVSRGAEIEWVANVVSAMLMNEGLPVITSPTSRGVIKAAEILSKGVRIGFGQG